jgi:hypothetical protein
LTRFERTAADRFDVSQGEEMQRLFEHKVEPEGLRYGEFRFQTTCSRES